VPRVCSSSRAAGERAIQDPRTGPTGLRPWLITTVVGVVTSVVGQVCEIA